MVVHYQEITNVSIFVSTDKGQNWVEYKNNSLFTDIDTYYYNLAKVV